MYAPSLNRLKWLSQFESNTFPQFGKLRRHVIVTSKIEIAFRKIIVTIVSHIQKINKNYNMIRLKMPCQVTYHPITSLQKWSEMSNVSLFKMNLLTLSNRKILNDKDY